MNKELTEKKNIYIYKSSKYIKSYPVMPVEAHIKSTYVIDEKVWLSSSQHLLLWQET